jgi:3-hydroxyisobutyrate dehydrogenase-like beta-hydroxyacid dehydrogenase
MAANWLAKGFPLSVWNRTSAKAEALAANGTKIGKNPRDAANGADFIFAMVSDDAASRGVWLGPDGALAGAKAGAIAVESSTLTPGWVRELAERAREKGLGFLDAPVGASRFERGARGR